MTPITLVSWRGRTICWIESGKVQQLKPDVLMVNGTIIEFPDRIRIEILDTDKAKDGNPEAGYTELQPRIEISTDPLKVKTKIQQEETCPHV